MVRAATFILLLSTAAQGAPEYRVIPLGTLWPITGLNDLGQVIGHAYRGHADPLADLGNAGSRQEGFRTQPFMPMKYPDDFLGPLDVKTNDFVAIVFGSDAGAINDLGQVVGVRRGTISAGKFDFAYRTEPGEKIGPPSAGFIVGLYTEVNGVNRLGQFTGYTQYAESHLGAFRSSANGEPDALYPIDTFVPPTLRAIPKGINDSGQVAGYLHGLTGDFAFRTAPNAEINLATDIIVGSFGGQHSQALGINVSGVAVGYSELTTPYQFHAFRSEPDSPMEDLGTLVGESGTSVANAINSEGWIVGYSTFEVGSDRIHAVLWRDGTMVDLHNLVGPLPGPDGEPGLGGLGQAIAITDSGLILATGGFQSWLLVPVPEPATWVLLAVGLFAAPLFAKSVAR